MQPYTLPVVYVVAICIAIFNTAGYANCPHYSAPAPECLFGWPNAYLRTELTPEQWDQVIGDGRCACGKSITPRELPTSLEQLSQLNRPALLANVCCTIEILGYCALVMELFQRRWKLLGPLTLRATLAMTAVVALFVRLSRAGDFDLYLWSWRFNPGVRWLCGMVAGAVLLGLVGAHVFRQEPTWELE